MKDQSLDKTYLNDERSLKDIWLVSKSILLRVLTVVNVQLVVNGDKHLYIGWSRVWEVNKLHLSESTCSTQYTCIDAYICIMTQSGSDKLFILPPEREFTDVSSSYSRIEIVRYMFF